LHPSRRATVHPLSSAARFQTRCRTSKCVDSKTLNRD